MFCISPVFIIYVFIDVPESILMSYITFSLWSTHLLLFPFFLVCLVFILLTISRIFFSLQEILQNVPCVCLSDVFLITRIWLYVWQRIPWSQGDLFITLCHKVPDVHLANVVLTRISYSVLWTPVTKQRPHWREEG